MVKHVQIDILESLSNEEWKVLKGFCNKANRLISTKLVADGNSAISGKVRYEKDKGLRFEATLPPEEQVAEFLMAFRFFYLKKEATYFPKILKIIGKHTTQAEAYQALKVFSRQWENSLFGNAVFIKVNGKQISTSLLLDIWFNAHYFHSDIKKGTELQKLKSLLTEDFTKCMLLDAIYGATKIVLMVSNGLQDMVNEHFRKP
jgi:hypothetical protein